MKPVPVGSRVPAPVARFDPEQIAAGLSATILLIVALVVFSMSRPAPGAVIRETAPPGASGTSGSMPTASAGTTPEASAAPPGAIAALLDTNEQILRAREDLAAAVGGDDPGATHIARILRALNPLLTAAETQAESTVAAIAPDVSESLAQTYRSAHAASVATLRSSTTVTAAYVSGASEVIDALEPLLALTSDLAEIAGGVPADDAQRDESPEP